MKTVSTSSKTRKKQDGYALMIVIFITTLILIGAMSISLRVLTEGRRQKEQEMIWRGNQYVRGIKLYYQKFGRFPTSLDDLTKPSNGNIRFMRQAYKDPMNKEDGSWRLIYVGPAGQLIGSLKPHPLGVQMPGAPAQPGAATGASSLGFGSQPGAAGGSTTLGSGFGSSSTSTTGSGAGAQGTDSTATGTDASGTDASGTGTDVPMGDTPTIMGGSIIGVGSKVNHASVIVYEKAKNYRLFEFVWDPSKDMGMISSQGPAIGTPAGTSTGTPGQNPSGGQTNSPNPGPPLSNPNPQ